MADEVETQAPPDDGDKKPEKTYTQAEVDRLIDIQRRKLKPISDELEALKTGQDETLKEYETTIKKVVDELMPGVDEQIRELIADMPILKQFEKLTGEKANYFFTKREFPLAKKKVIHNQEFIPTPVERFT